MSQCNDILSHMMFDEKHCNGLVLCNKFLPVEVLTEILFYVDCKTAMNCQLVCKLWQMLMNYVCYKKINQIVAKPFLWDDNMSWSEFYLSYMKSCRRNLYMKNHSGPKDICYWTDLSWCYRTDNQDWHSPIKRLSFCASKSVWYQIVYMILEYKL